MIRRSPFLVLSLLAGCATAGKAVDADPFKEAPKGRQEIRIAVENLNFNDARLFALSLGKRQRLGIVAGKRSAVFTIPWPGPEPLRIEIDLLAGPKCTTRMIETDPGDTLDLIIESVFDQTRYCRKGTDRQQFE
jgi:hypothetical protein